MRRVFLLLLIALLLTACGGGTVDLATATPPSSTPVETTGVAKVDTMLADWRQTVPPAMSSHAIKADSIKQNVYTTSASLQEVQDYYTKTFKNQNGWTAATRSPGLDANQGVVLDGYEHGSTSLVIGAIDATKFGGQGVVVYTATGNK